AMRLSVAQSLWVGALLQMGSNLAFVWLAVLPPSVPALTVAVLVENACGGIGTVVFVGYLSMLCSHPAHPATHYALLAAVAALGRTLFGAGSGYAAAALGWPLFFLATTAMAIPSLVLLGWLHARGHFGLFGEKQALGV